MKSSKSLGESFSTLTARSGLQDERERQTTMSQNQHTGAQVDQAGRLNGNRTETGAQRSRLNKHHVGWRKIVRHFDPSWFAAIMGTGIASILLHQIPYNGIWLYWLSVVVFAFNVFLFSLFFLISILRYCLYPEILPASIRHPMVSLFWAALPMGFSTIIIMICLVCVPAWGPWTTTFAWVLWILDSIVSVLINFFLPVILIINVKETSLNTMTAVALFPSVTTVVAAACGGVVAGILPNPHHAQWTLIISYVMWGMGTTFAVTILIIYYQRLILHNIPPAQATVSMILPVGVLGNGGFGIMQLGSVALRIFPITNTIHPLAGEIFYVAGMFMGLTMWGCGLVWFVMALTTMIYLRRFPFNMGWWGFTFPVGTYGTCTILLGKHLPSRVFDVLSMIIGIFVILMWIIVSVGTLRGVLSGELLISPVSKQLDEAEEQDQGQELESEKLA